MSLLFEYNDPDAITRRVPVLPSDKHGGLGEYGETPDLQNIHYSWVFLLKVWEVEAFLLRNSPIG